MYTRNSLRKRIFVFSIAFIFLSTLLIGRLYVVQIINHKDLQGRALDQWLRDIPTTAVRGSIMDRNGINIVSSYTTYDIYVRHALVKDAKKESKIYAEVLGLEEDFVYSKLTDGTVSENILVNGIRKEKVSTLLNYGVDSFVASEGVARNYNYNSMLSQVLGFTANDGTGLSGLELYYDKYLKGVDGSTIVESDASGNETKNAQSYYIPSIDGMNIELTIDLMIQTEVEKIMKKAKDETGASAVSCLVTSPKTGEILSIVSLPSYDLNDIPRDNLEELNALSRSFLINDTYEPGSTFKTIVAAIALDLGVATINTSYYCPGYRIVDGVRTNCHKKTGHGPQTLTTGFVNSCNCVFMQVVSDIGVDNFYKYVSLLRLDGTMGVDYPGEVSGIIIDKEMASTNDFLRMGFGQSIAISGLELAQAIAATCTNGYLMKPYFVKSIYTSSGQLVYQNEPEKLSQVFKQSIVKDMQYIMSQVVLKGGGKASSVNGITVGGKTGTAQKYDNGIVSKGNYIGSYICVSPVEDPEYLVLVVIDEPKTSIYGNIVATPVAGEILNAIYANIGRLPITDETCRMVEVPSLLGLSLTEAGSLLSSLGFYYVTEGEGNVVTYQSVKEGTSVRQGSSIMIKF